MDRKSSWLTLAYQLPARPAYRRVKVWRALQALGAVGLRNAVYALPDSARSREGLERLVQLIEQEGGQALLCESRLVAGLDDDSLQRQFNAARDSEYGALVREARALLARLRRTKRPADGTAAAAKLRQRLAAIHANDFFRARGRGAAEAVLAELEHNAIRHIEAGPRRENPLNLRGSTWVTRRNIHVDRIASAWLIERFLDPDARFRFVDAKTYKRRAGEYRFDMQDGEFTHEGDKCSFEVLLERSGLKDKALIAIAEIIHDIDLEDGKFARPETPGFAHVIAGIARTQRDDEARLAMGKEFFDSAYAQFSGGS